MNDRVWNNHAITRERAKSGQKLVGAGGGRADGEEVGLRIKSHSASVSLSPFYCPVLA